MHGRRRAIAAKYYREENRRMDEGNASGMWKLRVDFDLSDPVWAELIADGYTGVREHPEKRRRQRFLRVAEGHG